MEKKNERKQRVSAVPKDETKEQKFVRLGKDRLSKIAKYSVLLGKLASPNYEYNREQVAKIQAFLNKLNAQTIEALNSKFTAKKAENIGIDL